MNRLVMLLLFSCFLFLNPGRCLGSELIVSSAHQQNMVMNPCTADTDCEGLENAVCVNNFCECNGTKFCEDEAVDAKVSKVGETCQFNADCNIENSMCAEKKCKCKKDKVATMDGRRCLKVAVGLGSTCEDSIQCYTKIPQSGCQNEKCVCQQKTHEYEGACYNDIGLGHKCSHLGNCTKTLFARCTEEKCTCKSGYVPNNAHNKCLEVAIAINDLCYEDIQCSSKLGKAVCKLGFCQCHELYQFKKDKGMCFRDMLLGNNCEDHPDCHGLEEGESRLECIYGECKCRSEYVEEQGYCISAGEGLGYAPTLLSIMLVLTILFFHDNAYLMCFSFFFSIFYMLWLLVFRRWFAGNNNYLEPAESHED